ncbi:MAG: TatD family hydrolase [Bacteroidales bacterium]|nr:TatD family hydrolase [Bacteroidales bacterium]
MKTEIPFTNSHSHLPLPKGVLGIRSFTQKDVIQKEDNQYISFGLHPWYIKNNKIDQDILKVEELLQSNQLLAVGECGLDKLCKTNFISQQVIFGNQIRLAVKYSKPLIIHSVRSNDIILQAYDKYLPKQAWIMHGFNGGRQEIKAFSNRNFYFSLGGLLLNDTARIRKTIHEIPLDRLLLETDDTHLSIEKIYTETSILLNISINVLKKQIFDNFVACFSIDVD